MRDFFVNFIIMFLFALSALLFVELAICFINWEWIMPPSSIIRWILLIAFVWAIGMATDL